MAIEVKAPTNDHKYILSKLKKVFLAGSIEMGKAYNWQAEAVDILRDTEDLIILNPRRDDWDSSWEQVKENPAFNEQVNWELDGLERSNFIIMYLDPGTKSPISLLELGLCCNYNAFMVVVCPEGFWRKGNVDIVCQRFGIIQVDSLEEACQYVKDRL